MIFREPVPFDEAIKSRAVRALLPTTLTTDELQKIRPGVREQATFSAQTDNARHVKRIAEVVDRIQQPREGMDFATAMQELRDSVKSLGFDPDTGGKAITNLASDQRVRLIVEFNTVRAQAAGQYAQSQDETALRLWPAQEFYRAEDREEIRDWPAIWAANGGQFFEGGGDYPQGRMIALVNDPIWEKINAFGVPYAPFNWGSGMDVQPIDREEAESLGLIQANEEVVPEPFDYPEPESNLELSPELQEQVLADLGPGYAFEDDGEGGKVLTRI